MIPALVLLVPAVMAQAPTLTLQARLPPVVLQGEPLVVPLQLLNTGAEAVTVPDLVERSHRVRFVMTSPSGKKTVRHDTAPAQEQTATWALGPRELREVVLAVPSGRDLAPGTWQLTIVVDAGGQELTLGPHTFSVEAAHPTAWSPTVDPLTGRASLLTPWVHAAADGRSHAFLHEADARLPSRTVGTWYLGEVPAGARVHLPASRPEDRAGQAVWWSAGPEAGVQWLRGTLTRGPVRRVRAPYPTASWLGPGARGADGTVYLPFWVPSPGGSGGDVRVMAVPRSGTTAVFLVGRRDSAPAVVAASPDATGALRIALVDRDRLAVSTLAPGDQTPDGREVVLGFEPTVVRFDVRTSGGEGDGLGLFLAGRDERGVVSEWRSLDLALLSRPPAVVAPPGAPQVLPRGDGAPWVVVDGAVIGTASRSKDDGWPVDDARGRLWWCAAGGAGGVQCSLLVPEPAQSTSPQ